MLRAMATGKSPTVLYAIPEAAAKLCVTSKWLYERTRKTTGCSPASWRIWRYIGSASLAPARRAFEFR
jgi:hypothetical protein